MAAIAASVSEKLSALNEQKSPQEERNAHQDNLNQWEAWFIGRLGSVEV
jgi:hypothetical protein